MSHSKAKQNFIIQTKHGQYQTRMWWDRRDRVYLVKVPSLPGTATFGKTLAEAKRMARDAIELYCDCVLADGKVVVDDTGRVIGRLPRSRILVPSR